ncbi:hypothetical protein MARLIPOL_04590 [Marinobacter lipolyticus SM19]|uniref:Lipoprotein n=1 Tax=Marinobacter lipolyticus SM19 TaxID=1318628 RepID=R8B3W4_9GAMM|nr:hypothetical protein [Marinobacter lipolyticus]EON93282.1 hypothetical protein MARLIPOL_04590 [Marinobacter lipolyticus SM19]
MVRSVLRMFVWVSLVILVSACTKPNTPQEVAAAFWQAMAENDASDVVELSTLDNDSAFDSYERDWADVVPSYGRVVIDGTEASIVTRLPAESAGGNERREVMTYLVEQQGQWLVDYERTGEAIMNPSPFSGLMGQLSEISDRIAANFSSSSSDMEQRLNDMARELEAYSNDVARRADEAIKEYGQVLQDYMEELEESVNRALEENQQAPEGDRKNLEQAAKDLESGSEQLAEPSLEALASATRTLTETGQRLAEVGSDSFERNRDEWAATLQEIRERSEEFFQDLRDSMRAENESE